MQPYTLSRLHINQDKGDMVRIPLPPYPPCWGKRGPLADWMVKLRL
jgi:hypothetical protein